MSTAFLQQHIRLPQTTANTKTVKKNSPRKSQMMAWSNEKLRFSCIDNIGLKQLWKLIALDTTAANTSPSKHKSSSRRNSCSKQKANKINNNNTNTCEQNKPEQQEQQEQQQQEKQQQAANEKVHIENCVNLADYLSNRDILTPSSMSLLKFLAINALELSAPATPLLLQQQHQQQQQQQQPQQQNNYDNLKEPKEIQPQGWMQLSGHPESIVPTTTGIVRKRITNLTSDHEVLAYNLLSKESQTSQIVPQFYGTLQIENECFIELEDLLTGFKDPCIMDIKLGCRTFLESEVTNQTLRPDLYEKMIAVDEGAPTPEEHAAKAITKLRYMLFRETMSSSHRKGFRIEALRLRGRPPIKDLKTVRSSEQIAQTIEQFLCGRRETQKMLIQQLKHMRNVMEESEFFQRHEVVGSSIFIIYDDVKVGAWLIDFAKSRQLPSDINVNHRSDWIPGNREEGLLKGMDKLIDAFENINNGCSQSRKCLHI